MTTKKSLILYNISLIALMLCFAGVSSESLAAGPGMGPGNVMAADGGRRADMKWWHNDTFTASMDFNTDQKDALEEYSFKQRIAMIDLQANLQKARLILETSLESNFTKDTSLTYLNDYLKAKNNFEEARMKGLIHTREILTEEQFKILRNQSRNMNRMRQDPKGEQRLGNRMDQRRK